MGKKARLKQIRREVSELPVVMKSSHENHICKGFELIANGQTEINGEKVLPFATYNVPMPVSMSVNHYRRAKKLANRYGMDVVGAYKEANA